MRRGVIDTLRRALDNTIANWPLLLLRLAEAVIFVALAFAAVVAVLVPIIVSFGLSPELMRSPEGIEEIGAMLAARWLLIVYVFAVVTVMLIVFVAIHSFLQAGSARVYVDAERVAGPEVAGPRSRFDAFSIQRWAAGGADGWWTVFWIYNLAWGLASIIMMVPLLPTAAAMIAFRDSAEVVVASGCLGLSAAVMLMIFVSIVVAIWTNRAVVSWGVTRRGARESLASAWTSVKRDFGRLLLASLALFVVSMAGSTFFASFSFVSSFIEQVNDSGVFELVTLPIRFAASIVSTAFSAAMSGWFLAAFSSFAVEAGK